MMIVLAFIMLTQIDGSPLIVRGSQINIMRTATKQCHTQGGSGIYVNSVPFCVRETLEEIQQKLREAGDQ